MNGWTTSERMDPEAPGSAPPPRRRRPQARTSILAHGEPLVWLTGGALACSLIMIAGLLLLVFVQGAATFWPRPLVEVRLADGGAALGEVARSEAFEPAETSGTQRRRLLYTGNFELTGAHHLLIPDSQIVGESRPEWALAIERREGGRFQGILAGIRDADGSISDPAEAWSRFRTLHAEALDAVGARRSLERQLVELPPEAAHRAALQRELTRAAERADAWQLELVTADGLEQSIPLANIVRAYPPNRLSPFGKLGVYLARWWEFLSASPREANTAGGVFPAIFGTVALTLIMSLAVVPFGVLAALYLREYAKSGWAVSAVRIAVNNLAGVPSIVFGAFGLGFFCYFVGGSIDQWMFADRLPNPTFGKGGILWASLTLALLTLPVVIVATEEALAAVPRSMREASFACGASKWQTMARIVLPRALPGIITGMILAMARGAGEVAPLMMVGAVNLADELPIDGAFPFIHPQRSFMHLGFHIYDLGFQSQNSEAAKPMVFTTTLLLIAVIACFNLAAMWLRVRLRRRYSGGHFG